MLQWQHELQVLASAVDEEQEPQAADDALDAHWASADAVATGALGAFRFACTCSCGHCDCRTV